MNIWKCALLSILFFSSCQEKKIGLKAVSYAEFEQFVQETGYVTDAEKYGWSIVQVDVFNFKKMDGATWKKPDGIHSVTSKKLPVTQVSYNDAVAYCNWANARLPTYEEYWQLVKRDNRVIVSENLYPISAVDEVNVVGNVWDITASEETEEVRLAGGSLFCSKTTCNGTIEERALYVDKETGNLHIGFAVINL
jgi:hypothetical protein